MRDLAGGVVLGERCELVDANGDQDGLCDGAECVYRRALAHLGTPIETGCAIDHYRLLGDETRVKWLLSVKARLERTDDA